MDLEESLYYRVNPNLLLNINFYRDLDEEHIDIDYQNIVRHLFGDRLTDRISKSYENTINKPKITSDPLLHLETNYNQETFTIINHLSFNINDDSRLFLVLLETSDYDTVMSYQSNEFLDMINIGTLIADYIKIKKYI